MRYDFWCDPNGDDDLVLDDTGEFRFTSTIQESLTQRVGIRLKTWLEEWKYNTEFGTPYRQRLLRGGLTKKEMDAEISRVILLEEDVTAIKNIISSIDKESRKYTVSYVEVYCDDEDLTIPVTDPNTSTNTYPEPLSYANFKLCSISDEDLDAVNNLYEFINEEGLPENTYSTWWKEWNDQYVYEPTPEDIERIDESINEDLDYTLFFKFNGDNNYIKLPPLEIISDFVFSFNFYIEELDVNNYSLFGNVVNSDTGLQLIIPATNHLQLQSYADSTWYTVSSTNEVILGWNSCVITRSGSNVTLNLNGTETINTFTDQLITLSSIGTHNTVEVFNGIIKDVNLSGTLSNNNSTYYEVNLPLTFTSNSEDEALETVNGLNGEIINATEEDYIYVSEDQSAEYTYI